MNIIHLSSPSFGKENKILGDEEAGKLKNRAALDEVAKKLQEINARNHVDYIVITGDVAWHGSAEEYSQAKEWIEDIQKRLGLKRNHIILCPGNRDVDEEAMKDYGYPSSQEESNKMLKVERIEEHLSHRFCNYIEFIKSIGMHPYEIHGLKNYLVGIMELEDIRFVCLNTAWFSYIDKNNQGMWIGSDFVTLIQEQLSIMPQKFTVTLMHQKDQLHPNENGDGEHVVNTMGEVYDFSDMVLFSGFVSSSIKASVEKEAVVLGCGKPYETHEPYSQNICEYAVNFSIKNGLYVTQHLYISDDWRKTEDPVSQEIISKITWHEKYQEYSKSNWSIELPISTKSSDILSSQVYTSFEQFANITEVNEYYSLVFTPNFRSWLKDIIFEKCTDNISEKYVDPLAKEVEPYVYRRIMLEKLMTLIVTDTAGNSLSWDKIKNSVLENDNTSKFKLLIKGDEGTGKSAFLSVLYYRMRELSELQKGNTFTVFIDLHYFDKYLLEKAEEILNNDLKILDLLISQGMRCFMILDGFDNYKRIHESLEVIITDFLKTHEASVFLCLGNIELQHNSSKFSRRAVIQDVIKKPELELQSHYIKAKDDILIDIIRRLQAIFDYSLKDKDVETLIKLIKSLSLRQVDIRTIMILLKTIVFQPRVFRQDNPTIVFEEYLFENGYDNKDIYEEGKAALLYLTDGDAGRYKDSATGLYKNRIIRSYLVAYFFVNAVTKIGANKKTEDENLDDERRLLTKFKYIFGSDINHMISFYVQTLDENKLNEVFEALAFLFESVDTSNQLKINLAFVFGRIKVGYVKERAVNYLTEWFDELEKRFFDNYKVRNEIKDDQILIYRSISTSLVFQQETRYKKRYLKRLLYDSRLNALNRAFDTLYYGDCPRQLLRKSYFKNIQEKDIQDAVKVLYNRVDNMITEDDYKKRLSLDLEIMTLFSIIENALVDSTPLSLQVDDLLILINKIRKNSNARILDPLVLHFVNMMEEIISSSRPYRDIFKELLSSKYIFRTQWQEYAVSRDESMMEHIYSAFIIGEFCLPNSSVELEKDFQLNDGLSYDAYDKELVLRMILLSHLGNTYAGPYNQKTYEDRQKENNRYSYYAMLTTVPHLYGLGSDKDFWNEYYEDITINSKVARDVCHLENLMQAFTFKDDHNVEEIDLADIYESTMGQLQTALVKEICNMLYMNVIEQIRA